MSQEVVDNSVCEACGCAGEIGFVIKEGDDVAEVTIFAESKAQLEAEFDKYLTLAKQVSKNVEYNVTELTEESRELKALLKFEVSAEKLIFELKSRSLNR
ncbi:DUF406 family protein [Vibrio sp. T187]|uniref:YfcZ/YiiS family protein n=1 Tax=Vibrio TaxID=662 RepID=UPI0010CA151F|nr:MULTISPECIES: YfcZ/YiiS family protein [Vibrio]MBW3695527.1 DUF406 family protein [Vibrio sp. T187]